MAPYQRNPALVVILTIITCGIYGLYWVYVTSRDLNAYAGKAEMSPEMEVLLTVVTCGIYLIYWFYKTAKNVYQYNTAAGISTTDYSILCLVMPLVSLSVVSMAVIQNELNKLWSVR